MQGVMLHPIIATIYLHPILALSLATYMSGFIVAATQ